MAITSRAVEPFGAFQQADARGLGVVALGDLQTIELTYSGLIPTSVAQDRRVRTFRTIVSGRTDISVTNTAPGERLGGTRPTGTIVSGVADTKNGAGDSLTDPKVSITCADHLRHLQIHRCEHSAICGRIPDIRFQAKGHKSNGS